MGRGLDALAPGRHGMSSHPYQFGQSRAFAHRAGLAGGRYAVTFPPTMSAEVDSTIRDLRYAQSQRAGSTMRPICAWDGRILKSRSGTERPIQSWPIS